MSIYQIYFSPTNHTKQIVEIVGETFGNCENIDLTNRNLSQKEFTKEDICIIGVPSYGGRVPSIALDRISKLHGNGCRAILVVSYGNRAYEDTLLELQEYLIKQGFYCIAGISAVAQHSIMHQFATGRPDATDKQVLINFSKQIIDKLKQTQTTTELKLKGNHPYKTYNGIPLKPKVNKHCNECGLCSKRCPVGAIPITNPRNTDTSLCISCMRCIEICHTHARKVSKLKLKIASSKLKKSCTNRKENELFL